MKKNRLIYKECLLLMSLSFILISIGINSLDLVKINNKTDINYEYVDIKNMSVANIITKKQHKKTANNFLGGPNDLNNLTPINLNSNKNKGTLEEVVLSIKENTTLATEIPKKIWYLPTEMGKITQNPRHGHVALDITSPRGRQELIYPIANGVISGIYKDNAGARIVTILHDIGGKKYTSQYVHLSSYSKDIYVGKAVTINDSLGRMGSSGRSTGVHLHLALVDCALFDSTDSNCKNLNSFYKYANIRLKQGYIGLGTMINVPGEWNSR